MSTKNSNLKTLRKNRVVIMDSLKSAHDFVLESADTIVEETIETTGKIQKITAKAIKKSQPVMDKQMDIIMESIEEVKDQYTKSGKRLLDLLGLSKQAKGLQNKIKSTVKNTVDMVEDNFDKAEKTMKSVGIDLDNVKDKVSDVASKIKSNIVESTPKVKVKAATKKTSTTKATKTIKGDNLKAIKGIGPKMEGLLNAAGIKSYKDLASISEENLSNITKTAGPRFNNLNPTEWIKEANTFLTTK